MREGALLKCPEVIGDVLRHESRILVVCLVRQAGASGGVESLALKDGPTGTLYHVGQVLLWLQLLNSEWISPGSKCFTDAWQDRAGPPLGDPANFVSVGRRPQ